MIPLIVFGLAFGVMTGIVLGLCKMASKQPPMPTDSEIRDFEHKLMRKALMRGTGK